MHKYHTKFLVIHRQIYRFDYRIYRFDYRKALKYVGLIIGKLKICMFDYRRQTKILKYVGLIIAEGSQGSDNKRLTAKSNYLFFYSYIILKN